MTTTDDGRLTTDSLCVLGDPGTLLAMPLVSEKVVAFARDIKISHTVFAMPFALLAMFMAAGGWPPVVVFGLILVCMVLARTLAMSANRLLDAKLDAINPRTAVRAIPAGKLSANFYRVTIGLCAAGFVIAAYGFLKLQGNPWPIRLALPVLVLLAAYPLLKRFTRLCHYYLGMALGLAPVCAWVATAGTLDTPPILMGIAVLCWTAGFDILYACQDYQSDLQVGVHSVPAQSGIRGALIIARLTHLLAWTMLVMLWAQSPQLSYVFGAAVLVAGALLIYEHSLVKANDLSKLNLAFFTLNGIISSMLGIAGIIDVLIRARG